jgi:hypothetical protein
MAQEGSTVRLFDAPKPKTLWRELPEKPAICGAVLPGCYLIRVNGVGRRRQRVISLAYVDDYIEAALNKVAMAHRSLELLNQIRAGEPEEQVDIQVHFEGLIAAGSSAGDQLAEAFALRCGLKIRNNSPAKLLSATESLPVPRSVSGCLEEFCRWASSPVVRDANRRRRLAVHHHYIKRPYKPQGTWLLDEELIEGARSPYEGALDVHSYAAAYVDSLDWLASAARCLSDQIAHSTVLG